MRCITTPGASRPSVHHLQWCITDSSAIIVFDILESYHFQKYGTWWGLLVISSLSFSVPYVSWAFGICMVIWVCEALIELYNWSRFLAARNERTHEPTKVFQEFITWERASNLNKTASKHLGLLLQRDSPFNQKICLASPSQSVAVFGLGGKLWVEIGRGQVWRPRQRFIFRAFSEVYLSRL